MAICLPGELRRRPPGAWATRRREACWRRRGQSSAWQNSLEMASGARAAGAHESRSWLARAISAKPVPRENGASARLRYLSRDGQLRQAREYDVGETSSASAKSRLRLEASNGPLIKWQYRNSRPSKSINNAACPRSARKCEANAQTGNQPINQPN